MHWICYNGDFLTAETPVLTAQNHSFRYGDGVFETLKVMDGKLSLSRFHFERFFNGLKALEINIPSNFNEGLLVTFIRALCEKNNCVETARVRVAAFRDPENQVCFLIEAAKLDQAAWCRNNKGWRICVHPFVQKSCDAFANLKSANYLPYVMAARYAAAQNSDECIVVNAQNNIADGSRTNIFLIKNSEIYTPALHEGCVNGVMRRYLIDKLKKEGYPVYLGACTVQDLLEADEIFCTNALLGIQPVAAYLHKNFISMLTVNFQEIFFNGELVP